LCAKRRKLSANLGELYSACFQGFAEIQKEKGLHEHRLRWRVGLPSLARYAGWGWWKWRVVLDPGFTEWQPWFFTMPGATRGHEEIWGGNNRA